MDAAVPLFVGHFVLADSEGRRDPHLVRGLLMRTFVRAHGELAIRHHHKRWTKFAIFETEPGGRDYGGVRQKGRDRLHLRNSLAGGLSDYRLFRRRWRYGGCAALCHLGLVNRGLTSWV